MAYNKELKKLFLEEITLDLFKQGIFLCYRDGITSMAPLGFSGDNITLFGEERGVDGRRCSLISLRNYCRDVELLITDLKGNFLFYGRYDINLGVDFVAEEYFKIFNLVRNKIEIELEEVSDFSNVDVSPKVDISIGYEMLKAYQQLKIGQPVPMVRTTLIANFFKRLKWW